MNLRTKKTLGVLLRGAIIFGGLTVLGLARGGHLALTVPFVVCVSLYLAGAGYTWWYYGDSPKAVGLRAKAEVKRGLR
jgi:non-ribosomal peptide synthetase component F